MKNQRLQGLLDDVKSRGGSFNRETNFMTRDLAMYRACQVPKRTINQLRANTVKGVMELAPARIDGDWQLAGEHHLPHLAPWLWWGTFAEGHTDDERRAALRELDPSVDFDELRKTLENSLNHNNSCLAVGEITPEGDPGRFGWGSDDTDGVFMPGGWVENHSIRDYAKLVRIGYGGLKKEIEAEMARHPMQSLEYAEGENFWRAAMAICDAGIVMGRRYAEAAEAEAKRTGDPARKARLEKLAAVCRRVPEHGATTFHEAVQALWFGHLVTCCEDTINANSLGRLDQIFQPYLKADLEAGRITHEEALELQVELAIRLYLDYDVQAITLGGVDAAGKCAVNDASYLILEATKEFGEIRDLSVRINEETPDEFLKACAGLVIKGGGIPFFFNDNCFVKALADRGIALEDARNYAPIGCIELTIPGKTNPHAVSGWFNLLKTLELTLHDGCNPKTGRRLGPATGKAENFASYEELEKAFFVQVEHFAASMIYQVRRGEIEQRNFGALPGWSLLTDDCIKRGRDLTNYGSIYNFHEICLLGVPDAADSLSAIRKLVFEEKTLSFAELIEAMKHNFDGHANIRSMLLKSAPKYGNAVDSVDDIARKLCSHFIGLMDSWSTPDNKLFVHLFTFLNNISFGKQVGAMPDGRSAGEPLAYSLSAHQGRDLNGVTAFLNSLSKMPHSDAAGASAAIIDLHPSIFADTDPVELFVQLLKGAVAAGVGQAQWNVMSAEQLEKARQDPENHGNIPVRVAGYSQLFKLIDRELQDHIIARYKHQAL